MESRKPEWLDRLISSRILDIPPYIPGKPIAELTRQLGIADAVKMASNENPLGPSPKAMDAMRVYLTQSHVYPESSGPELRVKVAQRFGVTPESVILGNGSDEIMAMLSHVFLKQGDEVITATNAFSMYRICAKAFGAEIVPVPLLDYKNDLGAMAAAVTDRTKLIYISVPHSPTGAIPTREELAGFLRKLEAFPVTLVLDEAYREYVTEEDCPSGVDYISGDVPVLVLRTFSKIYGLAGLRVGYGIAQEWLIELLNRVRPPFNCNALGQVAAAAALDDVQHLERSKELTTSGIAFLTRELRALGMQVIPSQANFVTFRVGENAKGIYEALLNHGVIVRHLGSFGMSEHIRVTVGLEEENRRFIESLRCVLREPSPGA